MNLPVSSRVQAEQASAMHADYFVPFLLIHLLGIRLEDGRKTFLRKSSNFQL
jgi:hypothetical protein